MIRFNLQYAIDFLWLWLVKRIEIIRWITESFPFKVFKQIYLILQNINTVMATLEEFSLKRRSETFSYISKHFIINQYFFVQLMVNFKSYIRFKITKSKDWSQNKKHNCSESPAFKSQRVEYQSNQKVLHYYQHSKSKLNS